MAARSTRRWLPWSTAARFPSDLRSASAFREPEAVAWADDRILVVHTGNHRVVAVDPATGRASLWLGG